MSSYAKYLGQCLAHGKCSVSYYYSHVIYLEVAQSDEPRQHSASL